MELVQERVEIGLLLLLCSISVVDLFGGVTADKEAEGHLDNNDEYDGSGVTTYSDVCLELAIVDSDVGVSFWVGLGFGQLGVNKVVQVDVCERFVGLVVLDSGWATALLDSATEIPLITLRERVDACCVATPLFQKMDRFVDILVLNPFCVCGLSLISI